MRQSIINILFRVYVRWLDTVEAVFTAYVLVKWMIGYAALILNLVSMIVLGYDVTSILYNIVCCF